MKRWWVFLVFLLMIVGCGFVVVDKESKEVDYEALTSSVQALTLTKPSSYNISTPKTNEIKPMVYHALWEKSYLFFIRCLPASNNLYAVEMLPNGEFGGMKRIDVLLWGEHYAVFDGESNQTRVALIQQGPDVYVLQKDFSVEFIAEFGDPLSCLSVWNGSRWEVWTVFYNSSDMSWSRARFVWTDVAEWVTVVEQIIASTEVAGFLSTPLGGVGVVSGGETNFMLLRYELLQNGKAIFQQVRLSLKGGQMNWQTNRVYQGVMDVGYPFVDAVNGYQVYFSMNEGISGTNVNDLYRFRYLTWDKMIPRDLRAKLP